MSSPLPNQPSCTPADYDVRVATRCTKFEETSVFQTFSSHKHPETCLDSLPLTSVHQPVRKPDPVSSVETSGDFVTHIFSHPLHIPTSRWNPETGGVSHSPYCIIKLKEALAEGLAFRFARPAVAIAVPGPLSFFPPRSPLR